MSRSEWDRVNGITKENREAFMNYVSSNAANMLIGRALVEEEKIWREPLKNERQPCRFVTTYGEVFDRNGRQLGQLSEPLYRVVPEEFATILQRELGVHMPGPQFAYLDEAQEAWFRMRRSLLYGLGIEKVTDE